MISGCYCLVYSSLPSLLCYVDTVNHRTVCHDTPCNQSEHFSHQQKRSNYICLWLTNTQSKHNKILCNKKTVVGKVASHICSV